MTFFANFFIIVLNPQSAKLEGCVRGRDALQSWTKLVETNEYHTLFANHLTKHFYPPRPLYYSIIIVSWGCQFILLHFNIIFTKRHYWNGGGGWTNNYIVCSSQIGWNLVKCLKSFVHNYKTRVLYLFIYLSIYIFTRSLHSFIAEHNASIKVLFCQHNSAILRNNSSF